MLLSLFVGTMTVYASDMAISKTKITINVGDTYDLDITGTEKIPRWTSWNVNTVKVNQNGEITALRTGKTTVSARVGLSVKKCTVTVVGSSVKLNKSKATIYAGGTSTKTVQLKATVKGASKTVEWTSDNPEVATVDNKGKVTSVSAGQATITAKANDKVATCVVTVKDSSISLNMDTMQLSTKGNGSSIKLTPTIIGSSKSVKWTTSNKKIAVVSGGKVTGKGTGTAIITATANGVSTTCEVNVVKGSVSISSEKELLYTRETKALKTNAGKKDVVTWTSSDETVATVDAKGKITAVGAGTAVITASLNDTTDTCEVTVKDSIMSIEEDCVSLKTKGADKTYTLNFDVVGRSKSVKWTTSNKNIATVSNGKITAKKAGEVTITAKANGISDSVTVTVAVYNPTIKLNQSEYTLYTKKGNTYTLKATIDGPSKKVTYTSSNPEVATVNSKGKVTAVSEGQTIITATANDISAECVIDVIESKVILERYNIVLDKGEKAQIPADVVGYSQTLKYASTNSKIVTVKNGTITAKKYGEADIKVTANGITAVCHVTVGACEHSYDEGVITTEATCTELGVKTFTCTLCGDAYTENIPLADHNYSEILEVVAPTCTEQGYTLYICACGEITEKETKDALGHDWGEWETTKEPTEEEEGEEKRVCGRCETEEINILPKKEHEHVYESVVTEPTCTEQGYTTHTCGCGDSYKDSYVDATGHAWGEWESTKEPTEEETGLEKRICGACGEEETNTLPKKEHEHKYTEETVTEPTCTEQGYTTHICACGDTYKDTYVDATGHSYEDVVTAPTCKDQGYTTHTCSCGDSYADTYVDADENAHIAGEWVTTKEPTYVEVGTKTKSCTVCEKVLETEEIPMLELTNGDAVYTIELAGGETDYVVGHYDTELAAELVALVNAYRVENGKTELTPTNYITKCANKRGYQTSYLWDHKTPMGSSPTAAYDYAAENLAWYVTRTSALDIFNALKNCEEHNAVMLSNYTYNNTAVSVFCKKVGENDYEYYWVQIFD